MRKIFLIALGIVVLSAMGLYPQFDTFAGGPKVRSSKEKKPGKCRTHNNFETSDIVYARGMNFTSLTVDIYVFKNQKWTGGEDLTLLTDVSGGMETVGVDSDGEIPCTTTIWDGSSDPLNPLIAGRYDIVVDANQDGMFDPADGDVIDGRSNNAGFRVRGDDSGSSRPKVRSSKEKPPGSGECKPRNNFETSDDVYAKGKNFTPSTNVDIYVFENQKWTGGEDLTLLTDVSGVMETVEIGSDGKIPCTTIWANPLTSGRYDIVIDANQDGIFDPAAGDAVDHKSNMHGFKVR
ncbi:MAG: hypothetical protein ACUZ77_09865 [Candidatus Brocadiales bacterium]